MEKENWEEEFEKWVIKDRLNYISNRVYAPPLLYYEDIKSFIRQTLSSQKEKMLGVLLADIESMATVKEVRHYIKDLILNPNDNRRKILD